MILGLLCVSIGFYILIVEFPLYIVYGGFITKQDKLIDLISYGPLSLNSIDNTIISSGELPFISILSRISLMSKWYINGKGRIFRWSKLHRVLNQIHEQLLNDE